MNVGQVYGSGTGITSGIPTPPTADPDEFEFWTEVEKFRRKADEAYLLWQVLRAKRQAIPRCQFPPRLQQNFASV